MRPPQFVPLPLIGIFLGKRWSRKTSEAIFGLQCTKRCRVVFLRGSIHGRMRSRRRSRGFADHDGRCVNRRVALDAEAWSFEQISGSLCDASSAGHRVYILHTAPPVQSESWWLIRGNRFWGCGQCGRTQYVSFLSRWHQRLRLGQRCHHW